MGFGFGPGNIPDLFVVELQDSDYGREGASQEDDFLFEKVGEVGEHVGTVALAEGDGNARSSNKLRGATPPVRARSHGLFKQIVRAFGDARDKRGAREVPDEALHLILGRTPMSKRQGREMKYVQSSCYP